MVTVLWLLLLFNLLTTVTSDAQISFLQNYGYLPKMAGNSQLGNEEFVRAIRKFQRTYDLPITGILDETTKRAMLEPRCGLPDHRPNHGKQKRGLPVHRWETNIVTYGIEVDATSCKQKGLTRERSQLRIKSWPRTMHPGHVEHLVRKAFDQWEAVANLTFVRAINPLIEISFGDVVHGCYYTFGSGALAHAFFPGKEPINGDVHFSHEYNWIGDEHSGQTGTSIYAVAVHEIGHALGLEHNTHEPNSIMNPRDMPRKQEITQYDTRLLQSLYGPPTEKLPPTRSPTRPPPNPTPKKTTTKDEGKRIPVHTDGGVLEDSGRRFHEETLKPNPCDSSVDAVAEMRSEMYLFKDEWFWRVSRSGRLLTEPQLISNFFERVPYPIDAAVEVGNDMWLFVGEEVFVVHLQGTHIRPKHAPMRLTEMGISADIKKIDMAFRWHYFDPPVTYLWNGDQYWRIDTRFRFIEKTYPRSTRSNWKHVPQTSTAAFSLHKELHFIAGPEVYKMNSSDHQLKISKDYPKHISHFIRDCSSRYKKQSERFHSEASQFHSTTLMIIVLHYLL